MQLGGGIPIEKITVKVKLLAEGGAKLVLAPKKKTTKTLPPAPKPPQETTGKFSEMVKKRRK